MELSIGLFSNPAKKFDETLSKVVGDGKIKGTSKNGEVQEILKTFDKACGKAKTTAEVDTLYKKVWDVAHQTTFEHDSERFGLLYEANNMHSYYRMKLGGEYSTDLGKPGLVSAKARSHRILRDEQWAEAGKDRIKREAQDKNKYADPPRTEQLKL